MEVELDDLPSSQLAVPIYSEQCQIRNRGEISPMGEILGIQGGNESVWKLLSFQNW